MENWTYEKAPARHYGLTNKGVTKCIESEFFKAAFIED